MKIVNKRNFIITGVILTVLGLVYLGYNQVSDKEVGNAATANNLEGKTFRLIEFNGSPTKDGATVSFSNGKISAKFCNQMGGDYSLKNGNLQSSLIGTKMACLGVNIMEIESSFSSILSAGAEATIQDGNLIMTGDNSTLIFAQS